MAKSTLEQIREGLNHFTMEWSPRFWLDTRVPDLNLVAGHRKRGLAYGRITEMYGMESSGKTAISMSLAALAQMDGAVVIWGDLENSFEPDWALQRGMATCPNCNGSGREKDYKPCKACGSTKRTCTLCDGGGCKECHNTGLEKGDGLDHDKLILIQPYVGRFEEVVAEKYGKNKTKVSNPRLSTGVELCVEMEKAMSVSHKKFDRMFVILDSVASILTEGEAAAGLDGASMRTNLDLPMFMGRLLRRWVGMAQVYNAAIILVNQMRQNPMKRFGDTWYTPGGNAPSFYSHVRLKVARIKGSKIISAGKVIGIQGTILAKKNKTGGLEGSEVGYKLMFSGPVQFVPAKQIKKEKADADD
jgi:RecA/RadA recombinase